ncbi:IS5 family transposase [Paralysiella testudinis]|uniref:IS5 family transposase n=1 Tax=Paralysiella testudinis TaxID=2809020 RepID=UPI001E46A9CE|nr:IS5 family transposase [Paralysiella testudinis]
MLPILRDLGIYSKPNLRRILEGILYRIRTGIPWRDLPEYFGKYHTVYTAYNRWSEKGIFTAILKQLSQESDFEWVAIDGSYIRAHQHCAAASALSAQEDHAIGMSRGGRTSKIHLAVDAAGNPVEVIVTAGNIHDVTVAPELLDNINLAETELVNADKGYDSDRPREQIEQSGAKANIPYKSNREEKNKDMDWYLYKIRHLVENAFCRLKHFRAIASRYDKLKRNFHSTVLLGCIVMWLPL